MNRSGNIISNLSVNIYRAFHVRHDFWWREHRVKPDYTVWCITRGRLWVRIDGRDFEAREGDGVLFYPGNEYDAFTDAEGCEFGVVHFRLTMGGGVDLLYDQNLAGVCRHCAEASSEFRSCFMQGLAKGRISLERYVAFLIYLEELLKGQRKPGAVLFYSRREDDGKPTMQEAVDYIATCYRNTTVGEVAAHVHMNEKAFITAFKKAVGLTPGRYIFKCKMRKAVQLLSVSGATVVGVAAELNFSDAYAFSKAFKRYYGETPSSFKNNTVA